MTTYNSTLQIGWAGRDVTPDRPVNLQGQFHMRISKGVKDALTVTALTVSTENVSVVFVSCDIAFLPAQILEQCRTAVRAKTSEIDLQKIIMNATHTHTAPQIMEGRYPPVPDGVMTANEYAQLFVERAAEAVVEAWNSRKPGGISFGLGTVVVGHNRRATYFTDLGALPNSKRTGLTTDGYTKMYGKTNDPNFSHIEGYEDHYVDLLYTWDNKENLTGVVVNLACPAQETEGDYYVSADFWHEIRSEIRKRHGEKIQVLAQCSAAGDQSPHRLWYKEAEERMLKLRGLTMRQEIGRRVANTVDEVLPLAEQAIQTNLPLKHVVKEIKLPRRMITEAEAGELRADLAQLETLTPAEQDQDGRYYARVRRCRQVLERYELQKKEPAIPMELHVVRIGDLAVATSGFEYFLDFGIRIKARSPAVQTFLIQLAGDFVYGGSYLPTERAVAGKGYGGGIYDNEIGPEGGQVIVDETIKILQELLSETSKKI